jgi:hypothetical protein
MRGRFLQIIVVSLVLAGFFIVPVLAQSPLADVRERVNGVLVQLRTFDNTCIIILGAQIKEIDISVLESRKLITSNKGNLNRLLLEAANSAAYHVDRLFDTLAQCRTLLGTERVDGSIFAEVNGIADDIGDLDDLDPRKDSKISGLIDNTILANLAAIHQKFFGNNAGGAPIPAMRLPIAQPSFFNDQDILGVFGDASSYFDFFRKCLAELLSAGIPGSNCSSFTSLFSSSSTMGSGELEISIMSSSVANNLPIGFVPQLTEKGAIPFEFLRLFKIALGIVHQGLVQAQRTLRQITQFKKWVYKGLREVHNLLRASNFGGRGAGELLVDGLNKIYTLNGALVAVQTNGLYTMRLANGVYLAVIESRDASGKVIAQVRKVVVTR